MCFFFLKQPTARRQKPILYKTVKKNLTPPRNEKNHLDKNTPSSRCSDDTVWPVKCLH